MAFWAQSVEAGEGEGEAAKNLVHIYCDADALMVGLETFCCVFVVDVTKETAAW